MNLHSSETLRLDSGDEKSQTSQTWKSFSILSGWMRWISTHSKATLLTSSQRIRELEIAKMRREEIERQNKFAICLQQKANELDPEKIAEDNQRKLIEAKMVETELKDAELEINLDMKKIFC